MRLLISCVVISLILLAAGLFVRPTSGQAVVPAPAAAAPLRPAAGAVPVAMPANVAAAPAVPAPVAAAATADKPQEKAIGPFNGTVVDPAGKPVAGAKVLMLGYDPMPMEARVIAETVSDEKGQFHVGKQTWDASPDRPRGWFWTARDSQGRIAGQINYYRRSMPPSASPAAASVELKIQDGKDYHGRLLDMSGQPVAKASVRPMGWNDQNQEEMYSITIFFPAQWDKEFATETDADGRFTLHNMPTKGMLNVKIRAEGFGEPYGVMKVDQPATLKLSRVGSIQGAISCSKDPKAVANVKLRLAPQPQAYAAAAQRGSSVVYTTQGTTKADGSFRFENVPASQYQVMAEVPPTSPYLCDSPETVEVKPGQTATAALQFKPATTVKGKVVDQTTGEGIAGVRVSVYFQDGRRSPTAATPAPSNAKGEFTLHTRTGKAVLQIYQVPDQYLPPSNRQQQTVEIKGNMTLDPIRLDRANVLEGIVVDKAGKPVADAEIRYTDTESSMTLHDVIRSDAAGKFTLKKTAPKKNYMIRARTKTAAAEPMNVVPERLKDPLRLVVDEKASFAVRGVAVDDEGKPLPQVDVSLITHWSWAGGGVGFVFSSEKTDAEGRFQFGGLWSGDKYQVRINAKDRATFGTPEVKSTPGDVHDFGTIAIAGMSGAVEGMVSDSAGKPLDGVRVFNSGDGVAMIQTTSDKAGHFRLQGFRKGPVYVFAEKDGFRFTGARTASGTSDVALKMLRTDEPAPKWAASSTLSEDEQRNAARRLLEKLYATDTYRRWACMRMARIDPELAEKWAKEAKVQLGASPDSSAMKKMAEEDLDEALSVIGKQGASGFYALKELATSFVSTDPDKAARCAEEALVRARSLDQPQRAIALAQIGALVARLGNKDAARKITDEAAEMAEKWTPSDRNQYMFGTLAVAVASNDLPRAMRLLEKIPDKNQRESHLANIAAALDDVDKAEAILKDLQPWSVQRARMKLAYHVAATRPAEAIRLVEKAPTQPGYGNDEDNKALAYGWLATAIAPHDAKLAYDLVDRAFAIYLKPAERSYGNYGGRSTQAAVLAVQAQQIGYPDMESLIYRVLASRPVPDRNDFSPVRAQESCVMMAMLLALVDPPAAKQILESVEPQSAAIGSGYSGIGRGEWLKAWALADPKHAADLAEKEMAVAGKDDNEKQRTTSAATEMVELWLTPASERLKYLSRRLGSMFLPDQE